MEFRLLGPVEAATEQGPVELGRRRERALLALLLLEAGRTVPVERLVELLFDGGGPGDPRKAVQVDVSRLRRTVSGLADEARVRIVSDSGGYAIHVDPATVDVHRFTEIVERARSTDDPAVRAEGLRSALALWRGTPIPELADVAAVAPIRARLEQLRLEAVDLRVESDLTLGRHVELVAELADLSARYPASERLLGARMLALYRSGRKRDALDAYRHAAGQLADELGLDPGPELRDLHTAMLRDDPELAAPEPRAPTTRQIRPAQLPADLPAFTGREDELSSLLARCRLPHESVVIVAIDGMAGIGKTALAVHAAHQLAADYPDGQLYLDLNGFTEGIEPTDPDEALARLLRGLGVPDSAFPVATDERAALYRSVLADKRVLVLLDNATSEDQVRHLLPATTDCLCLVTSRQRLAGLDQAVPITLDVLPSHDATALLARVAGPELIAGDSDGVVRQVVDLCGRLPLAIRLAAARLRTRSSWTVADLLERLRDEHHRLAELEVGDRDVAGAFALSYRQLPAAHQRMFRLLGLHPGSDIDADAAAALAACPGPVADRMLGDLVDIHLVTEPRPGRYSLHDLLRAYAVERVWTEEAPSDRAAARDRLFAYYRDVALAAMNRSHPDGVARRPADETITFHTPFASSTRANAWMEDEIGNLLRMVHHIADSDRHRACVDLTLILRRYLQRTGRFAAADRVYARAVRSARHLEDRAGETAVLVGLGNVRNGQGRYDEATVQFRTAIRLAQANGVPLGEIDATLGLGSVAYIRGAYDAAAEHQRRALALARENGDLLGQRTALGELGLILAIRGYYAEATAYMEQGLEIARRTGNPDGELAILNCLGYAAFEEGRLDAAAEYRAEALELAGRLGERIDELRALNGLGNVHHARKHDDQALACHREVVRLAREIGDLNYLFEGRLGIGTALCATGDPEAGLAELRGAHALAEELEQQHDIARTRERIGDALRTLNRTDEARTRWQEALEMFTELDVPDADRVRERLAALDQGMPTS